MLRRSPYAAQDIKKGTILNESMFEMRRPEKSIPAEFSLKLIGLKINKSIKKGQALNRDFFDFIA